MQYEDSTITLFDGFTLVIDTSTCEVKKLSAIHEFKF